MGRRLVLVAALIIVASCTETYLPAGRFSGCYEAPIAQQLRLARDGLIFADGAAVGRYKVLAPVGGKHGALVEASGLNVSFNNGRVMFAPGSGGFYWAVTDTNLRIVFALNGDVEFTKTACH